MHPLSLRRAWLLTVGLLAGLIAWDAAGIDLPLARLAGSFHGFPLRDHWLVSGVLHQGGRVLAWLVAFWLLAGYWRLNGHLRWLSRAARTQWLAAILLSLLAINVLKHASHTSCPWDLAEFGGAVEYVSHWDYRTAAAVSGHCFPAGHAAVGFAFIAGFFALGTSSAKLARQWLAGAVACGLVLGIGQQLRGAHYMSHTLWTGWICWFVPLVLHTTAALFKPRHGQAGLVG